MIVKKFQAPTETEAILAAKEELGAGAVVLNVKNLTHRGIFRLFKKDLVEITAALEEKEVVQSINQKKPTFEAKVDYKFEDNSNANDNSASAIEAKLDSLHTLLKAQMTAQMTSQIAAKEEKIVEKQVEVKAEPKSSNSNFKFLQLIYNKLLDNEVDEKYANMIIDEIDTSLKKEANIDSILSAVYQKIILKLGEPEVIKLQSEPTVVFFIGPTGVGKTTTIAKLASKFKLLEGKKVAFISADTYRIAAVEQLNTYANIMDIPSRVVYSADEMKEAVTDFKDFDLIIVDTAGRSHKDQVQKKDLYDLCAQVDDLPFKVHKEIMLVLSLTTKYKDLVSIVGSYADLEGYKLIFTKLDETLTMGNILNIKMMTNASLSYTTCGQNVPDDIEVINVQKVVKQLLGGNE